MCCYEKTVLYLYPMLESIISQIDGIVLRRALASFSDTSPCVEQAERIIKYTEIKKLLIGLKIKTDKLLGTFTEDELKYFEYKYFRRKPKIYYEGFDTECRNYFRKQQRLLERFSRKLNSAGMTEVWFSPYLEIPFVKDLSRRIAEREKKKAYS